MIPLYERTKGLHNKKNKIKVEQDYLMQGSQNRDSRQ